MTTPEGCVLAVEDAPPPGLADTLADHLLRLNERHWPGHPSWQPFAVTLRRDGALAAGVAADAYAGLLSVKWLWVEDALRGRGVGRALMQEAERQGAARGCVLAWLDTIQFQAPGFYERLGYEGFGQLAIAPGRDRILFRKRLGGV